MSQNPEAALKKVLKEGLLEFGLITNEENAHTAAIEGIYKKMALGFATETRDALSEIIGEMESEQ